MTHAWGPGIEINAAWGPPGCPVPAPWVPPEQKTSSISMPVKASEMPGLRLTTSQNMNSVYS